MNAFYDLILPKAGDTITLIITHIKTACNFYINLNPFDHNLGRTTYHIITQTHALIAFTFSLCTVCTIGRTN